MLCRKDLSTSRERLEELVRNSGQHSNPTEITIEEFEDGIETTLQSNMLRRRALSCPQSSHDCSCLELPQVPATCGSKSFKGASKFL